MTAENDARPSGGNYSINTSENQIIINDELVLTLHIDTPDGETVEPDSYEWLDTGAFGLHDSDTDAGEQVQMVDKSRREGGCDE